MNFSKIAWIGLCTLTVGILGCPGDDGDSETTVDTQTVTTSGPSTTTGNDTTGGETTETPTGGDETTTTAGDDTSTGGAACDPPCPDGEMCVQGVCLEVGDSSGEPPMCDVAPLDFGNPACNTCLQGSCCGEMMTCFGDSSQVEPTSCLELNNCVAMNCQGATDLPSLQMCVEMNCGENADQLNTWLGFNQCAAMNCLGDCMM